MRFNHTKIRPLSWIKMIVVKGSHTQSLTVPLGLFKGLKLMLDLSNQTQLYFGLWERETYKYIRKAAGRCRWMVDVGAGKGELCLFFYRKSEAQRVLAIEPQRSEVDILRANIALNDADEGNRLEILSKLVTANPSEGGVTLDALNLPHGERGFIKIDVDGYEMDVLRSGTDILSNGTVDLLVETHSEQLEQECIAWLLTKDYKSEIIKNAWWRLFVPEQRPGPHNRWLWATRAQ